MLVHGEGVGAAVNEERRHVPRAPIIVIVCVFLSLLLSMMLLWLRLLTTTAPRPMRGTAVVDIYIMILLSSLCFTNILCYCYSM